MSDRGPEISLELFSKIVEAIYDCALDPNRWHEVVVMIAELSQSQRCTLGVHDYANGCNDLMFQVGWEDEYFWRLHEEKYSRMNPFFVPLQMLLAGTVVTSDMLVNDDEFLETRYWQEWVKPQGLALTFIAFKMLQTGQRTGLFVANRLASQPRYGDAEVRLLTLLAPHLCRAGTVSDVLNLKTIRSEALEATLNALVSGVYLTDRHGRVVFMNSAAEQQVKTGNALRIANNRLTPVDHAARVSMSNAIAEAMTDEAETPASGMTLALPGGENTALFATILPLNRGERRNLGGAFASTVAIFVKDPIVVPAFPGEAFAKLHHLTGAELRVLLAVLPGLGVKEAAEMLGIGETTAKTHLQHIFAKTGTSKQTELMHLFTPLGAAVKTR